VTLSRVVTASAWVLVGLVSVKAYLPLSLVGWRALTVSYIREPLAKIYLVPLMVGLIVGVVGLIVESRWSRSRPSQP